MYMQCTTIAALLSLLSIVQSTSVSVNCVAPWVSTAVRIFDGLPSSEGFYYCSTLLSKYQTVTVTSQKYTGTIVSTSVVGAKTTGPIPMVTSTTTSTKIISATAVVTTSAISTDTVYNTITAIVTGTVIIPASITVATGTTTVTDDIVVGTTPAPLNRREPVENSRIFRGKRDAAVVDEARIEKRNTFNLCSTIGIQSSLLTGFCSCVATGTTSTITSTYTTNAEFSSTTTVTHVTATITPSTSVVQVVVSATSTGVFYTSVVTVTIPVYQTVTDITTATVIDDVTTTIDIGAQATAIIGLDYNQVASGSNGVYSDGNHFENYMGLSTGGPVITQSDILQCLAYCDSDPACVNVAINSNGEIFGCYTASAPYNPDPAVENLELFSAAEQTPPTPFIVFQKVGT